MLAKNEREWLENRQYIEYPFCMRCPYLRIDDGVAWCKPEDCQLEMRIEDWQEAAEFSERVAVKLASYLETLGWKGCENVFLKAARLAVEEEMDV